MNDLLESIIAQSDFDSKIEDFLSHHGVRGQKWGIRKTRRVQRTLDRLNRVSKGTNTFGDRVRVANFPGVFTRNQASEALKRGADLQKSIKSGNTFATQFLSKKGQNSILELNYHQPKSRKGSPKLKRSRTVPAV